MIDVRSIYNAIYTRKALALSRDAYNAYCNVQVKAQDYGYAEVSISVKPEFSKQARQIILEFWNYLLDASCQQHLNEK